MDDRNTWPGGVRKALHQDEHERWNASHYPGTRQSLPKDSQEIISEKLSQNDADVVTKRQASEIEQRAAVALLSERADFLQMYVTNLKGAPVSNSVLYTWARFYTEAYDYAKSIGAIETLNHSNTKTQGE